MSKLLCIGAIIILSSIGVVTGLPSIVDKEIPELPNATEIDVSEVTLILPYPFSNAVQYMASMPHHNEIVLRTYSTNATPFQVLQFVSNWTSERRCNCEKVGMVFMDKGLGYLSTDLRPNCYCIEYYGYTRGPTAVGIVIVSDGSADCMVLYTKGFILYYYDIMN